MNNEFIQRLISNAPSPFLPEKLPFDYFPVLAANRELSMLLLRAGKKFGEYCGYLENVINPSLLISPLVSQEAVLSSKLEGTHATLEDLLNYDANVDVKIDRDEMKEIANYRQALFFANAKMSQINIEDTKLPLSTRLIKEIHKILLDNVRGSTKNPGNFKKQQNYIVSPNGVVFTPVPANNVQEYMSNLEQYIHREDDYSILLQTAIIHCQFEMIHPFEDGNGRIGRLLIPLFLFYRGELPAPTFYMSSYFNRDRNLYLNMLNSVSTTGDWTKWFEYFLNGIIASSEEGTTKAQKIHTLYEGFKEGPFQQLKSAHAIRLLDFIFRHPVFNTRQVLKEVEIPIRTAYDLLNKLVNLGTLTKNDAKRNIIYLCPELINIL